MTNFDKYKHEILNLKGQIAKMNGEIVSCYTIDCQDCDFHDNDLCHENMFKWLYEEYNDKEKRATKAINILKMIYKSSTLCECFEECNGCPLYELYELAEKTVDSCKEQFESILEKGIEKEFDIND